MPVIFANEYDKYTSKVGGSLFTSFLSSPVFQDVIKPSIPSVIELGSNIKEIKDSVKDEYESKTTADMDNFNNFNKVVNMNKVLTRQQKPKFTDKELKIFTKIIEETKKNKN